MKKAQAALEFLTTYGWAFMVFVGVIGYLSYIFIVSPTDVVPNTCTFSEAIICRDAQVMESSLDLSLESALGSSLLIVQMKCISDNEEIVNEDKTLIPAGNTEEISCGFSSDFKKGDKVKIDIVVTYIATGSGETLPKVVQGSVVATAKELYEDTN
ncbi:hypothetical protein K9L97_01915 [Candidatus Woesearchaeota archaeon]|nr:hypothetical protein [Candidatus Woesearchaeota archaeon]